MSRGKWLDSMSAHRWVLLTLAVALAVRLGLAFAVQAYVDRPPARLCLISGDAEGYWELAQNIVAGRDFAIYEPPRYVLRVPGFPIVLALSQQLFGASPLAVRCLLACVGTLACGLTYWLGCELVDSSTGLLAAVYTALSPTMALFSVLILSETLFAATLLLSLIAIARLTSVGSVSTGKRIGLSVIAGALIGIANLVRPTWLYVGTAIAFVVLALGSSAPSPLATTSDGFWRPRLISLIGLLVGIGLCIAPWTIRNYYVTGHIVPTTLWVGPSLYDGLHPGATGDSDMQFIERDQLQQKLSEYEVDREYRRRAWEFASQHPYKTWLLALKKQQRYWSLVPNAEQFRNVWLQVGVCLVAAPLLLFGLLGIWVSRRNLRLVVIAAGPVLLFAALHLLFVGSLRYRLPAEYPLAILAAVGVRQLAMQCGLWKSGATL